MTNKTPIFRQICGISNTRGKEFRNYLSQVFKSQEENESDGLWRARLLINGFNEAINNISDSYPKVVGESTSSISFGTTVKGGLPHLSYILCKS